MLLTLTTTHRPATDPGYLPYAASSFLSVAIARVFPSALAGRL